jgi:hypothetical protein
MPVPYSQANLKARFETGDIPTQQDYADLIDTFFSLFQTAEDDAAAALVAANAAAAGLAAWSGSFTTATVTFTETMNRNIASVTPTIVGVGVAWDLRFNFTVAFANANYLVLVGNAGQADITASPYAIQDKTANYITLRVPGPGVPVVHLALIGS